MTSYDRNSHVCIVEIDEEGLGYDWHTGALLTNGMSGQLYWAADSGCSCTGFLEQGDELIPVANWQEAVEHAKEEFGDSEAARFAESILDLIHKGTFIPTRAVVGELQHKAITEESA